MRVRLASETDLSAWQEFVDASPDAGCMHHAGWYDVLRDACWVDPYFLIALNDRTRSKAYCRRISAAAR